MAVRHACTLCGKLAPAEKLVYSTHTGNRYCPDLDACKKRARRKGRTPNPTQITPITITTPPPTPEEATHSQGGMTNMARDKSKLKTLIVREVVVAILTKADEPVEMKTLVEKVLATKKVIDAGIPKPTVATQIGRMTGDETPARIVKVGRGLYAAVGVKIEEKTDETVAAKVGAEVASTFLGGGKDEVKPDPKSPAKRSSRKPVAA